MRFRNAPNTLSALVWLAFCTMLLTPVHGIDYLWLTQEQWEAELNHPSKYRQRLALAHFARDGVPHDELLPILIDKLRTAPNRFVYSYDLYQSIGNFGKRSEPHIPLLIDILKMSRAPVYLAFRGIGRSSIAPLNEVLDSGHEEWQLNAIRALEQMNSSKRNERLYHWLEAGSPAVRAECAHAIWECYEDPIIATTLAALLESPDRLINRIVTRLVGEMGVQAAPIESEIAEVLSKNPRIRGNYFLKRTLADIQKSKATQP